MEKHLPKPIPLNYQVDFCRTSGKRSGLLPVRLGQRAHAPAFGRSVSSCGSNGAFVRSRWISRSIHARSSRTVVASAFLSFRMAAAFRYCWKHSFRARRWSFGCYVVDYITTVMWGNRLCGIRFGNWRMRESKRKRMPHNFDHLQRSEKRHQSFIPMPWFRACGVFHLAQGQGSRFRFQINLGIDVGCVQ